MDAERPAWTEDLRIRPELWLPLLRRLLSGPVEEQAATTLIDGYPPM